jgi:hypothetical protein
MHFDERMDRAVLGGYLGGRQRFTADADPSRLATNVLRLIAVKTLAVHFRDQDGAARSTSLPALRTALEDLERCLKQAWRNADALAGGLVKKCVNARQAAAFWVDDSVDTSPPST